MLRFFFAISLAATPILPATAATLSEADFITGRTIEVYSEYSRGAGASKVIVGSDTQTGTSANFLQARTETSIADMRELGVVGTGPAIAQANYGAPGISNVFLEGQVTSSALEATHTLYGRVQETVTGVIPASVSQLDVLYSFTLSRMLIEIWDNAGLDITRSEFVNAQFKYNIDLNGTPAYFVSTNVGGTRDAGSFLVTASANKLGAGLPVEFLTYTEVGGPGDVPRSLIFDDISETGLKLGTVVPTGIGVDTFTLTITMDARLIVPSLALDAGGLVNIGDPNALQAAFGTFSGVTPDTDPGVIPLPAAGWLLLGGLACLARLRRG